MGVNVCLMWPRVHRWAEAPRFGDAGEHKLSGRFDGAGDRPTRIRGPGWAGGGIGGAGGRQLPLTRPVGVTDPHSREPAGPSYPRWRRWASATRIHETGAQAIRIGGPGGRQLSAFAEPMGASYPHWRTRWATAIRIRGADGRKLSAGPGGRQLSAFAETGGTQAIRIDGAGGRQLSAFGEPAWPKLSAGGAGGRQLSAFEEPVRRQAIRIDDAPVGVSYPHSREPVGAAIRIGGAGGRQLSAFAGAGGRKLSALTGPVGVSSPHSRSP